MLHLLENNWMHPPAPYYSPWVDNFTQRVCPDRLSTPLDLERHPVKIVHANHFLGLPCQSGSSIDAHGELVMRPLRGTYPRGGVQRCPHWISMGAREALLCYSLPSVNPCFIQCESLRVTTKARLRRCFSEGDIICRRRCTGKVAFP